MDTKAQDARPWNLRVRQPNVAENNPANDGFDGPLTSEATRIRVGVTDGKSGSSSSKKVQSYAKQPGELNGLQEPQYD